MFVIFWIKIVFLLASGLFKILVCWNTL